MLKESFAPIANENSRILILGTMPGERSLKQQEYYGHKGNQFWKIIFALFSHPFTNTYEVKRQLLLDKGIALWDVLQYCERAASSDKTIVNEVPNDFPTFYKQHTGIRHIFFSSAKASEFYRTHITMDSVLSYHQLPSPSSANTWKSFDQKFTEWRRILEYL